MSAALNLLATETGIRLVAILPDGEVSIDLGWYGLAWFQSGLAAAEVARHAYGVVDEQGVDRVWSEGAVQVRGQRLHRSEGGGREAESQIVIRVLHRAEQIHLGGGAGPQSADDRLAGEGHAGEAAHSFHGLKRGERINGQRPSERLEQGQGGHGAETSRLPVAYLGHEMVCLSTGVFVLEHDGDDVGIPSATGPGPFEVHQEAGASVDDGLGHEHSPCRVATTGDGESPGRDIPPVPAASAREDVQ